ncbi:MAG TPA: heme A synthase [Gammaproteobacteria bacterium]|nr:heme A synthase [Gammaproteobacteria bacterium]
MSSRNIFIRLVQLAAVLALLVVMLGAYTRLSDAGLGCPDWPGCYGHLGVPESHEEVARANEAFPQRQVEAHKAWKEMIHRYFAGTLGLLILTITILAWRRRHTAPVGLGLPMALLAIVVFQALLGMWTVTLLVKPLVVTSHLIGGFTVFVLLWLLLLRAGVIETGSGVQRTGLKPLATLALGILVVQILLGGWTSTNYAAVACTGFPTCNGEWWPQMDFSEGFVLWRGLGINYEFGVLDSAARKAVHMTHRIGALVTFVMLLVLALRGLRLRADTVLRRWSMALLAMLVVQVALGIANVTLGLPLGVAVAHNGVGALLLAVVVTFNYLVRVRSEN